MNSAYLPFHIMHHPWAIAFIYLMIHCLVFGLHSCDKCICCPDLIRCYACDHVAAWHGFACLGDSGITQILFWTFMAEQLWLSIYIIILERRSSQGFSIFFPPNLLFCQTKQHLFAGNNHMAEARITYTIKGCKLRRRKNLGGCFVFFHIIHKEF